jgi:hypothetical protein
MTHSASVCSLTSAFSNTLLIAGLVAATGTVHAQSDAVGVDLSGVLVDFPSPPDITRDSLNDPAPGSDNFINDADGYTFSINGLLQLRDPIFGAALGDPVLLTDLLDQLQPGNSRLLSGWIRNQQGSIVPDGITVWQEQFVGGAFGAELDIRLEVTIDDAGIVTFAVRDINSSLGFLTPTLDFQSGTASLSTWVASERQLTEWHFDGNFETADGSDNSAIRYLDDPAFGTILGGIGNEETPNPGTPTGITAAQSMFTDTVSAGLPAPGGIDTGVYLTSPARNLSNPTSDALRRGIGLAVYPAAKPAYPGGFIGQWTMVWDMLIPASSWYADFPANTVPDMSVALLQDQHNNDSGADLWLRTLTGDTASIVYTSDGDDFAGDSPLALPAIRPGEWFRLAVVCDEFQAGTSRVFVNGVFAGEILSDWVYNAVDPTPGQQFFGDGEAVDPADWAAWGEFPSPWALSEGTLNPDPDTGAPVPNPLASTFGMFCDLRFGDSEPVYLANYLWVDDLMPDSEVIGLGGPSGDGILLTGPMGCNPADLAEPFGVLDLGDIGTFVQAFTGQDPIADIAPPAGVFDLGDLAAFVTAFSSGCP